MSREPGAGSREPGAGSREPGAGSREPGAESVWGTVGCERTVLVVARTLTSTYRLLEALTLFRDDFRIRFVFAVDDTSEFSHAVHNLLVRAGARPFPWSVIQSPAFAYDLALCASENIDFDRISGHTIVLPHGLGFNKVVPDSRSTDDRLAGLPPEQVLREGRATIVLSHPEQRAQLLAASPATAGRTEVVGDPTFDQMWNSRGLRPRYRDAFGTGERTLVTLASTWRPDSVFGRWRTLPHRLLGELPADLYQVAAILHPNIWTFYGELQISLWLSSALEAGLVLVPPEAGWQAALLATDQVVADHGSLGLFAAALDKPLLLAGHSAEVVSGTPVDALARSATALDPHGPLRAQLDAARNGHRSGQYDPIADRVFAHVGHATDNLRNLIYRELDLKPASPASSLHRIAIPAHHQRPVTSHVVHTTAATDATLIIERFPASTWTRDDVVDTHVVADETEPDLKILERAGVLTRNRPLTATAAGHWAQRTLTAHPGARIAVSPTTDGSCLAVIRGGQEVMFDAADEHVQLAASAIYCCLLSQTLTDRELTIRAGVLSVDVTLRVARPGRREAAD